MVIFLPNKNKQKSNSSKIYLSEINFFQKLCVMHGNEAIYETKLTEQDLYMTIDIRGLINQ